jgi:DtxR family Mn-dependent transcriptional regulator
MVRRHRLLETFLAHTLGYAWDEVHDEAERLEHAVTEVFLARIDELLGHPLMDPHGDPIPGPDGTLDPMAATADLTKVPPGDYVVARVADTDSQLLAGLAGVGLRPGVEVTMTADGRIRLVAGDPVSLGTVQLGAVRVYLSRPD